MLNLIHDAADLGAHLIVFPELALTGYPPEDLLFRDGFITKLMNRLIFFVNQHLLLLVFCLELLIKLMILFLIVLTVFKKIKLFTFTINRNYLIMVFLMKNVISPW